MNSLQNKSKHYEQIKQALLYVDEYFEDQPNLEQIASHIGMSKHHFARIFKEYVGVTAMQFLQLTTFNHAKKLLEQSSSILDASLDVGLSSSSRLHEMFVNFIGVTPNEYKKMGENLCITYGFGFSPFGATMIASTPKGICALEFYERDNTEVSQRLFDTWNKAQFVCNDTVAQELLDRIFIKKEKMNLFVKGTNFQINVWKALLNIKPSQLSSYSEVAKAIGKPKAVRAVATAIGSNHIGFLIPCHRVISKTASMGGYRWGVQRKQIVLAYEQSMSSINEDTNKKMG